MKISEKEAKHFLESLKGIEVRGMLEGDCNSFLERENTPEAECFEILETLVKKRGKSEKNCSEVHKG